MELKVIQKMIAMFPEGPKKEALMAKLSKLQAKENTGGGLHDEFSFKPKGHIMIEEIDGNGQVLGVLADQPNLVVDGAEEVLLRAFSGDPKRMLYKNRKIKEYKEGSNVITGKTVKFHSSLPVLATVLDGEDVVAHHQNEIWKDTDDSSFDIEYSYYPNTLYVKQELVSDEPGKITFRIYDKANAPAGSAPLQAEVYSTFSNLFIGLGDGESREVELTDSRLKFTNSAGDAVGGWTIEDGVRETETETDKLVFEEKISNVKFTFLKSATGGQVEVLVDGSSKGIIDLYDSTLQGDEVKEEVLTLNELNLEVETKVEVKFTGADDQIVGTPRVAIKSIEFDAFKTSDNGLLHEFENFTLSLDTPAVYNTTSEVNGNGTYTIHLEHFPVVAESLVVDYNELNYQRVETLGEVASGKFFVDDEKGIVHFKNPLTGLLITYDVTGEVFEDEPKSKLTSANQVLPTEIETNGPTVNLTSQLNGVKKIFSFNKTNVVSGSATIRYDADGNGSIQPVELVKDVDYTLDAAAGEFELIIGGGSTFSAAPSSPSTLSITGFKYMNPSTYNLPIYHMVLEHELKEQKIRVKDHTGVELSFVETELELEEGKYTVIPHTDGKIRKLVLAKSNAQSEDIEKVDIFYYSDERPGVPTNYTRQVILKPKEDNEYPWFALDKGSVVFVAEFDEGTPSNNVTIREMGLFDGPRVDDNVRGFTGYPVKAFSLVRVGDTRKEASTGLRITWTITLLNENDEPFKGGL